MGVIGGLEAPQGRVMGHAGAWAAPGEPDAKFKYKALEDAGVVLVDHPEKLGTGMKQLLSKRPRSSQMPVSN
jgi:succinyl-CoA synthetase alpha subunit